MQLKPCECFVSLQLKWAYVWLFLYDLHLCIHLLKYYIMLFSLIPFWEGTENIFTDLDLHYISIRVTFPASPKIRFQKTSRFVGIISMYLMLSTLL